MKRFAFILAIGLAACAVPTGSNNATETFNAGAVAVSCPALTADAMFAAESAYNVAATAYVQGAVPASAKAKAKPTLLSAYTLLKGLRTAYAAKDAIGFCSFKNDYYDLIEQAKKELGK